MNLSYQGKGEVLGVSKIVTVSFLVLWRQSSENGYLEMLYHHVILFENVCHSLTFLFLHTYKKKKILEMEFCNPLQKSGVALTSGNV